MIPVPDFRSATGLFAQLGKGSFTADEVRNNFEVHQRTMGQLAQKCQEASRDPTPFHHMLAYMAEQKDRTLHRIYTQNIDGIEDSFKFLAAGHPNFDLYKPPLTINKHGSLRWTVCRVCRHKAKLDPALHILYTLDNPLECTECIIRQKDTRSKAPGKLRPWVVVTGGEAGEFANQVTPWQDATACWDSGISAEVDEIEQSKTLVMKKKLQNPPRTHRHHDTLAVVGTSASGTILGIQHLIRQTAKGAHRQGGKTMWINLTPPPQAISDVFDEVYIIDCQVLAHYFFQDKDFSDIISRGEYLRMG